MIWQSFEVRGCCLEGKLLHSLANSQFLSTLAVRRLVTFGGVSAWGGQIEDKESKTREKSGGKDGEGEGKAVG